MPLWQYAHTSSSTYRTMRLLFSDLAYEVLLLRLPRALTGMLRQLVAGGLAGIVEFSVGMPMDTVKTRSFLPPPIPSPPHRTACAVSSNRPAAGTRAEAAKRAQRRLERWWWSCGGQKGWLGFTVGTSGPSYGPSRRTVRRWSGSIWSIDSWRGCCPPPSDYSTFRTNVRSCLRPLYSRSFNVVGRNGAMPHRCTFTQFVT